MISTERLQRIKKDPIGKHDISAEDMGAIQDAASDVYDALWIAYKLGFSRGRKLGGKEGGNHEGRL